MFSEDMTSSAAMRLDAMLLPRGCVDEHKDTAEPIFLLAVEKGGGRRTARKFPLLWLVSRLSGRAGSGRPTSAGRQAKPRGWPLFLSCYDRIPIVLFSGFLEL